jgi:outer membrane murein-binding lipoprotein Lpp
MNTSGAAVADSGIDHDLSLLEGKLETLVAHARELRAANETLRRDLAAAHDRNRALSERVAAAAQRLDALLACLPETAE